MASSQKEALRKAALPFGSITNYIECALREFSCVDAKKRLCLMRELIERYTAIDAKLAHTGANLNQAMHRINELAKAGMPYAHLLESNLAKEVMECRALLETTRTELRLITESNIGKR